MFTKIKQYLGVKTCKNLSKINEAIEDFESKMDILGSLPIEILHEILMYLSPSDLHNIWKCCRKWRSNMEFFWKRKCTMEGYFECEDDLNSKFYIDFLAKHSKWKGIYMYNRCLEDNWIKQNFKEIVVKCRRTEISTFNTLKYIFGDVFILTLKRNNILVIDCTTGFVIQRFCLPGFEGNRIRARQIGKYENWLIVVSEMNTYDKINDITLYSGTIHIKVWNIKTGYSLKEFQMKMGKVDKILIYKNLVTILTRLNTANIINIKQKKLDYQRSCIISVFHCNDKIAMGTKVGTIIIMNLDYAELMTLNCFDSDRRIDDIEIKDNYLIGLSRNTNTLQFRACVYNIETKTKLYQIDQLWRDGLKMCVNKSKLIYLCPDGKTHRGATLKCCDLDSGKCISNDHYEKSVNATSHDYFILHESPIGSFQLWSIKSKNVVSRLCLPEPTYYIWSHELLKTKSKLAYFDYSLTNSWKCSLRIINFEAAIEI